MLLTKIFNLENKINLYLSSCDLLNKSLFNSVILKPRIDKIVLSLCLNKPDENFISFNFNEKVESFLTLYLLNLRKPLLVLNNDLRISTKFFKLKSLLSEKSEIDLFVSRFFNEKKSELSAKSFLKEECSKFNSILINKEACISLTTKLNLGSFFEISSFLDENYLQAKLKKLDVKVDFYFKGSEFETEGSTKDLIKNTSLFWVGC